MALSPFLLSLVSHPSIFSPELKDFCRMRKRPSQVTRLVSNYHSDVLQPPGQKLGAMQGEVGAPGSGASGREDGMHLWVLWEGDREKQTGIRPRTGRQGEQTRRPWGGEPQGGEPMGWEEPPKGVAHG